MVGMAAKFNKYIIIIHIKKKKKNGHRGFFGNQNFIMFNCILQFITDNFQRNIFGETMINVYDLQGSKSLSRPWKKKINFSVLSSVSYYKV